jgi:hypothetical protein
MKTPHEPVHGRWFSEIAGDEHTTSLP